MENGICLVSGFELEPYILTLNSEEYKVKLDTVDSALAIKTLGRPFELSDSYSCNSIWLVFDEALGLRDVMLSDMVRGAMTMKFGEVGCGKAESDKVDGKVYICVEGVFGFEDLKGFHEVKLYLDKA